MNSNVRGSGRTQVHSGLSGDSNAGRASVETAEVFIGAETTAQETFTDK